MLGKLKILLHNHHKLICMSPITKKKKKSIIHLSSFYNLLIIFIVMLVTKDYVEYLVFLVKKNVEIVEFKFNKIVM